MANQEPDGGIRESHCPFCRPEPGRIVDETPLTRTLLDAFPVTPGHTLVTTRRHVDDLFQLTESERNALWECVCQARDRLVRSHSPDGFNVGVNIGRAAGQTVMHVHVHVIPRYRGDVAEPRGGVRGVIPGKMSY